MNRLLHYILVLALAALPALADAALTGVDDINPSISADTQKQIDTAVMTYYREPSVEKVNTVLDIMTTSDVLRKKTAWPTLIGFLTVVFAAHPEYVMQWISRNDYNTYGIDVIVASLMHAKLKDQALVFAKAEEWKPEAVEKLRKTEDTLDLKKLAIVLPGHIDTLWGAFFGSGDPVYVNEIINVLFADAIAPSTTVPTPPGYDILGENKTLAKNTLRQYAAQHQAVRTIIETRLADEKDPAKKKMLQALLPDSSQ